jgi:hypothetical protein
LLIPVLESRFCCEWSCGRPYVASDTNGLSNWHSHRAAVHPATFSFGVSAAPVHLPTSISCGWHWQFYQIYRTQSFFSKSDSFRVRARAMTDRWSEAGPGKSRLLLRENRAGAKAADLRQKYGCRKRHRISWREVWRDGRVRGQSAIAGGSSLCASEARPQGNRVKIVTRR